MEDKDFLSLEPPAAQAALDQVSDESEQTRLKLLYARENGFLVDGTGWTPRSDMSVKPFRWLQGRTNRAQYWLTLLAVAVIYAAFIALSGSSRGSVSEIVLIFVCVPRLHDLGATGWIAVIPFGLEIVCAIIAFVLLPVDQATTALGVVALVLLILLIVLGALPGQPGANRFGPQPRRGISFGRKMDQETETAPHFD
jgi:uncharacterized membrane protein YhaH (DUF805 family)